MSIDTQLTCDECSETVRISTTSWPEGWHLVDNNLFCSHKCRLKGPKRKARQQELLVVLKNLGIDPAKLEHVARLNVGSEDGQVEQLARLVLKMFE